jgi:hypothetical protein
MPLNERFVPRQSPPGCVCRIIAGATGEELPSHSPNAAAIVLWPFYQLGHLGH